MNGAMQTLRDQAITLLLGCLMLAAATGETGHAADLMGTHGDWKAYRHVAGGTRICFAVTGTSEQLPQDDRRKPFVYITAWPNAGIKAEVSVLVGTPMQRGAEIKADIGGNSFILSPDGDRAFIGDEGDEQRFLDAMRRGRTLVVATTTAPGTTLRDTYSLTGVTAAMQAVAADCQ